MDEMATDEQGLRQIKLTPLPVAPFGKRTCVAFVDRAKPSRSGLEQITIDHYAPTAFGNEIHWARINANVNLRDVAFMLKINVVEYSGLENGRYTLPDEQWDWLKTNLTALLAARKTEGSTP